MKDELAYKLNKNFPHVFSREIESKDPFSVFYFEVGDGWYHILYKAAKKLEPLFIKAIKEDPNGYKFGWYRTSQIKEKYGSLRWYLSGGTDEMYKIVSQAETESEEICEQCGDVGKIRGRGWYYTACYTHSKPEDRNNLEILEDKYNKSNKKKIKNRRSK